MVVLNGVFSFVLSQAPNPLPGSMGGWKWANYKLVGKVAGSSVQNTAENAILVVWCVCTDAGGDISAARKEIHKFTEIDALTVWCSVVTQLVKIQS